MSDNNQVIPHPTLNQVSVRENTRPSLNIIGCGGCGINIVRVVLRELSDRVSYYYLDASMADVQINEVAHVVEAGGSGLVRASNSGPIFKMITEIDDDKLHIADINIVVFSLSGGSGSVIGPLLLRDIAERRKKQVIAVVIASSESETHAKNTADTIKSLQAVMGNTYLPIMIFDNAAGRSTVDRVAIAKLSRLVDMLTLQTRTIDKRDRLHWLNGSITSKLPSGMQLMHIEWDDKDVGGVSKSEVWNVADDYIFDAILQIDTEKYQRPNTRRSRAQFTGQFVDVKFTPMTGLIGAPPDAITTVIQEHERILGQYKSQPKAAAVTIAADVIDPTTGLVL